MKRFFLILIFSFQIYGQDSHNWNFFPGSEAALNGASSFAGVNDFSTAFYNPGYLAFVKNGFNITAHLYFLEGMKLFNGAGEGNDIKSVNITILPDLTASRLPINFDNNGTFAYVVFQKQSFSQKYSFIKDEYSDLVDEVNANPGGNTIFSGDEFYSADFTLKVSESEYWAGLAWGRSFENWGIGLALFTPFRMQTNFFQLFSSASDLQNNVAVTTNFNYLINYYDVRMLLKSGIVYHSDDFGFGLTFTTPGVHIFGSAEINGKISSSGIYFRDENDNVSGPFDFIATNKEDDLSTNFRSPFSFAFGLKKKINNWELGFGCEYFGSLPSKIFVSPQKNNFVIVNPLEDDISANGKFIDITTYQKNNSIFNFGFSIKNKFTENFSVAMAFFTDYSTTSPNFEKFIYVNTTSWNIYHFSLGTQYLQKKTLFGISIEYSYSRDASLYGFTNLNSQKLRNGEMFLINNKISSAKIFYNRILFNLGVTYFL